MLKVSAFYLEKQNSFIPKKNYNLGVVSKAVPIFSEGFDFPLQPKKIVAQNKLFTSHY